MQLFLVRSTFERCDQGGVERKYFKFGFNKIKSYEIEYYVSKVSVTETLV